MKEYVLKTDALTKTYKGVNALDKVNLSLEQGKIYGLIGQNGAGKTTLMRIIAGLAFPSEGSFSLFGKSAEKDLANERKRMGCIIDYPGLSGGMTAVENMRLYRMMKGIPNKEIESELLQLVGLPNTGKKKVKNFSMGMKQRLGIAIALIGNPDFLMLDEPINGLDPLGIVDIRNLLKNLCNEKNISILISSHNLPELYQTVTDYIIIHEGKIKETLTVEQLDDCCKKHIYIKCDKVEELIRVLESELGTSNYKLMPDKSVKLYEYLNEKERLARILAEHKIIVTDLSVQGDTLENYFISVIGG